MHPPDPIPHAAIRLFGRLLARGWLAPHECMEPLAAAVIAASPARDPAGLRCRALQALRDSTNAATRARRHATRAVRAAIQPPVRARASACAIRQAAHAANEQAGHPLSRAEVEWLAAEAAASALNRNRFQRA